MNSNSNSKIPSNTNTNNDPTNNNMIKIISTVNTTSSSTGFTNLDSYLNNNNNYSTNPGKNKDNKEPLNIFNRIFLDCISAISAGFCVSPFVSIIDKAITQNASGALSLTKCLKNSIKSILGNPIKFTNSPEFRWIFFVYSNTYISANNIESFCKRNNIDPDLPKFLGVSSVNITCSILKDRAFARLFGTKTPGKVPKLSLACFGLRDSLTVLCSFVLPNKVSLFMQLKGVSKKYSDTLSQLICPCFVQIFSTPLHLFGLDKYNNNNNTFDKRIEFIKREYFKTTCARMSRIFPAFGIGGLCNKTYRSYFIDNFEKK